MEHTKKLIQLSNYWYNDGLSKAQIHDTSGAITSLKRSLYYQIRNTDARNLLGLVYYGRGEVGMALVQWIISKNYKSHENLADYFITKVQGNPAELEVANNAIKKYNQCLVYCQQNGEDLALIQLKKIVHAHPTFLKAHLLLALLYIRTEQYSNARHALKRAHKLDTTNEMALRYMHELSQLNRKKAPKIKEEKEQTITYQVGNDTIIQPAAAGIKDNGMLITIVNILIGLLVGAAMVWFLIVPGMEQSESSKRNREIVKYSDQIAAKNAEISALKKELEGYRDSKEDVKVAQETAESTQKSYENLMTLKDYWNEGSRSDSDMVKLMLEINQESLGTKAETLYKKIRDDVGTRVCEKRYRSAKNNFDVENFDAAIQDLELVLSLDEGYENGKAMVLLVQCYEHTGNKKAYKEAYDKAKELFPSALKEMEDAAKEEAETDALLSEQTNGDAQSEE